VPVPSKSLNITVCYRPIAALRGEQHAVTSILREVGYRVTQGEDTNADLESVGVVWVLENAGWFPRVMSELSRMPRHRRPFVIIWHWEPLPPPKSSGLKSCPLHTRELAKIMLRDSRATDVHSNLAGLIRLAAKGLPDLLAVSSFAWKSTLADHGIHAHWEPIGYRASDGEDLRRQRDIEVMFLGDLNVPRRRRILSRLRTGGLDVWAGGSWTDPSYWNHQRTELLNRVRVMLNIQRQPGEIAAHRLILGMANGAMVVSEPILNPTPFAEGLHFRSSPESDLEGLIRHYLACERERQAIATAGHRFVTTELTMRQSVHRLLQAVEQQLVVHDRHQTPSAGNHQFRNRGSRT